jgi:hypothetical protein
MLCDVLLDSISRIEAYQRTMPAIYGGPIAPEIEAVKAAMRALQAKLNPPGDTMPENVVGRLRPWSRVSPTDELPATAAADGPRRVYRVADLG